MVEFSPDFLALSAIEEELLASRLEAARKVITHAGEKGRSLEAEVNALLRSFLPVEYGLSTGFVVYHTENGPQLTTQLDIIVYDVVRSGPIARLATCDVFPLEAVYAYIEVKASLKSTPDEAQEMAKNSIELCIQNNGQLRQMRERRFWAPLKGTTTSAILEKKCWTAVRSYVVTFSAEGGTASSPDSLAQRMADYSARIASAHLHGVFVAGSAFYCTCAVEGNARPEDSHNIQYTTKHPLAAFKWTFLHDLARFPRFPDHWAPAIDQYRSETGWKRCAPKRGT